MAMSLGTTREKAEINVTPMIDVLLVLIIVFMVILPHNSVGLDTQIPQLADTPSAPRLDVIVVSVDRDRAISINNQAVSAGSLENRLREILAARASKVIFLRGHSGLDFQDVARVIDIARGAGAEQVGLMSE